MARLMHFPVIIIASVFLLEFTSTETTLGECDPKSPEYNKPKCMEICLNDKEYMNTTYCQEITSGLDPAKEVIQTNITIPVNGTNGEDEQVNSAFTQNAALSLPIISFLICNKIY